MGTTPEQIHRAWKAAAKFCDVGGYAGSTPTVILTRDELVQVIEAALNGSNGTPKKPGFHVISLKRSKKLQRLHDVLLNATEPLSSLELTKRTNLVAISTWCAHLRKNDVALANEQRTVNGQQVWYWWIEK